MASQVGLGSFSLRTLAGAGKRTYVLAIQAAMSRDYVPLETLLSLHLSGDTLLPVLDQSLHGRRPILALAFGERVPNPFDRG